MPEQLRASDALGALEVLSATELQQCLAIRDLTDPAAGPHAMQLIVAAVIANVTESSQRDRTDVRVVRRHPVVGLDDNYDRLGYPRDSVTREARYSRYVDADHMLRSHTTAMIPGALRALASEQSPPREVLLATPGLCYRRDAIDWQHTGTPQQLDLWPISSTRRLDDRDLVAMIGQVVAAALPGRRWRTVPKVHPYTLHGRQVDVWYGGHADGEWIEIGECGLAHPNVLADAGLSPGTWSGLAMGLGVDRLLMLRKQIPDIRLLRSADPRVTEQMLDLEPYRPVSHMPAVRRDLSIVIGPHTDASAEALGDRVLLALGADAAAAETVEPLSETAYDDLPPAARERLGIEPGQRNLLVRVVLRALDRTLTDAEANALRDKVYATLHEGSVATWAAPGSLPT